MGWYEPDEPRIAPCCENCDDDNCPGEDNCLRFLKAFGRERFYTDEEYTKIFEGDY